MIAMLVLTLLGMSGQAYASHTSVLQIDATSVHLRKDGTALITVRANCTPGADADQYAIQPLILLADRIAYEQRGNAGATGTCTGKWERYKIVLSHVDGQPLLTKHSDASVLVFYQLYPQGYENCEGRLCSVYEPGSHRETVPVR
jgi:hypothetical protein